MPNDSRNLMRVLAGEDASDDNSPPPPIWT